MTLLLAGWLLAGCCVKEPPVPPPPPPPGPPPGAERRSRVVDVSSQVGAPAPEDPREQLVLTLSLREGGPECGALSATVDDLAWVVENVPQPPWVGVRAAECLLTEHAGSAADTIVAWAGSDQKGLALLVLGHLDDLPEGVAVEAARGALEAWPDEAAVRIRESQREAVRALAE